MTEEEAIEKISGMSHMELARAWRFAPIGDPIFHGKCGDLLSKRLFVEFGGFTPQISKELGWGHAYE